MTPNASDSLALDAEERSIAKYTEKAYLDYSMYVVLDRALPHVADGLKPVQRRIVYAMSELGLSASAKFKKSARTVGDVLGKFHPHGDSACYEAMVLMAQPFSFRYPLVDGQGNWGAPDDPKSFAAMRYTESRLTKFSQSLLSELKHGTVDWVPNFDGTLEEPQILPSRLPHVLLNGASGIAVGMATDIPPHNVREMVKACIYLLKNPTCRLKTLTNFIQGPDYPTEAEIITPKNEITAMYETGSGGLRMRARWRIENGNVVIWALPYQVSGGKILEQIAAQMQAKKLPMVDDLRDESDHENPTRLVIEPRSNRVDLERLMSHLFASTDLERSYRVNMNAIGLDRRPRLFDLKSLLAEWLEFRISTVRRRLQSRLEKVAARLHVLEGYLVAYLNIDEVIRIIRTEDEPKPVLMERFSLTDAQAEAILELKLRHLARLEEMKLRGEQDELLREKVSLEEILGSDDKLHDHVRDELEADAEEFGDERRSPIVEAEAAKALDESDLIPSEPITVVLSQSGWVRGAKGHEVDPETLSYRSGDGALDAARGRSNKSAVFLDSSGRSYAIAAHSLPSARGHGEPLSSSFSPPAGAKFVGVLMGEDDDLFLLASDEGYGFVTKLEALQTRQKAGKAVLSLPVGAEVVPPRRVGDYDNDLVAVVTSAGHLLIFPISELPQMQRGKGNKMINIPKKQRVERSETVSAATVLPPDTALRVLSGQRTLTLKTKDLDNFIGARARRGGLLPRGYRNHIHRIEPAL